MTIVLQQQQQQQQKEVQHSLSMQEGSCSPCSSSCNHSSPRPRLRKSYSTITTATTTTTETTPTTIQKTISHYDYDKTENRGSRISTTTTTTTTTTSINDNNNGMIESNNTNAVSSWKVWWSYLSRRKSSLFHPDDRVYQRKKLERMTTPEELERIMFENSNDVVVVGTKHAMEEDDNHHLHNDQCSLASTTSSKEYEEYESNHYYNHENNNMKSIHDDDDDDVVAQYFASREMTPFQERMNAITIIPAPIYCIYFCIAGLWLQQSAMTTTPTTAMTTTWTDDIVRHVGCFHHDHINNGYYHYWTSLPILYSLPSLPPLPVLSIAIGFVCHAPWSFLYHWKYAHTFSSPIERSNHWSRRCDQAMIHFGSLCCTYGTTGSIQYFFVNLLYNIDCVYKLFQKGTVQPKRNQFRLAISIMAYTFPVLRRLEDWYIFFQIITVIAISSWFFIAYPIGGWSHSVFHLIGLFLPSLLLKVSCNLPASQNAIKFAEYCITNNGGGGNHHQGPNVVDVDHFW